MNIFDILILLILVFFIFRGLYRGFIRQFLSLVSIVAGVLIALAFYQPLSNQANLHFNDNPSTKPIVFIILLVLTSLLINYLAILLTKASKYLALGTINRLLGAIFGVIQAFVILLLLASLYEIFANEISFAEPNLIKSSILYPHLINIKNALLGLIPASL